MNFSNLSPLFASRSLWLAAGLCAAVVTGCDDKDKPTETTPNAARPETSRPGESDAGKTGAAGRAAADGAKSDAGAGSKPRPVPPKPRPEEDAGIDEADAGSDSDSDSESPPRVDPNPTGFRDLSIQMSGFTDEVDKYMQVSLIGANGELLTMAVLNGLPSANYTLELPDTIPPGQEVELQIWADTTGTATNAYEPAMDHAWTQTIAAGAATVPAVVRLTHGTQTPPPTASGGDAAGSLAFMLMGTSDYGGNAFELRIYEDVSGRLVARHLMPVPGIEVAYEIYGVLKTGTVYHVDFAIDVNNNKVYDDPPADASWRRTVTATATGNNGDPGAALWFWALPPTSEYVDVGF